MKTDFSGYATKNGLRCSDGRIICRNAFKENDGQTVPLVWQHIHDDPSNVLGHARLENRDDGVYAYCSLNESDMGQKAKELVRHGDITSLSIYANQLVQNGPDVVHGNIREVSLVLSGANPGAVIENLSFQHSDDSITTSEDEAIIYTGLELAHADQSIQQKENKDMAEETQENSLPKEASEKTVKDVFEELTEEQKQVVYFLIGQAVEEATGKKPEEIKEESKEEVAQDGMDEGDSLMHNNVFEASDGTQYDVLSHSDIEAIFADAKKGGSLREAVLQHAGTYGIDNISMLFPDAQAVTDTPDLVKRRTEWVNDLMGGTKHTPFARIKSLSADLTFDTARAKGYITGRLKKEEFFGLAKRVTNPTTIYKKQKLDRDDIVDITSFDVVAFLKSEMRLMLDEEIARAVLVGDGREADHEDKINEECIRPIWKDDDFYALHKNMAKTPGTPATPEEVIDFIIRAGDDYEGTGLPTLYITADALTDMLLLKDKMGRYVYETQSALASKLGVGSIVKVPVMKGLTRDSKDNKKYDLVAIMVNPSDYTIGADRGGELNMFDDFDIDYNQYKYLMETRISGALTKPKSAIVFENQKA